MLHVHYCRLIKVREIENELLTIMFAVKTFYKFIHRRRFRLQTGPRSLITVDLCIKKCIPSQTANRLK